MSDWIMSKETKGEWLHADVPSSLLDVCVSLKLVTCIPRRNNRVTFEVLMDVQCILQSKWGRTSHNLAIREIENNERAMSMHVIVLSDFPPSCSLVCSFSMTARLPFRACRRGITYWPSTAWPVRMYCTARHCSCSSHLVTLWR